MIEPQFWANRKVLLTGHTGFKGAWLALWLHRMGARITGYALPPTEPSLFAAAQLERCLHSVFADVRDLNELRAVIEAQRPEIVFHLAAQSLVRRSLREPVETFATNVMGTVNVLAAASQCASTRAVVIVTSDKCYQRPERAGGNREDDALGGRDPYSASKACAELVTAAYRETLRWAPSAPLIASVRAGNVVGGGDWAEDRLIPDLVRAFERGAAARIRYPDAIRPWQYVLDALSGYLLVAEHLCRSGSGFAGAWNFCPPQTPDSSVRCVADALARAWGEGAHWVVDDAAHPAEAQALRLDSSKAQRQLGWRARTSLAQAIEAIANWHRACADGADMRRVSEAQLESYCAGA